MASTAFELQKAIRKIIAKFIAKIVPLTADASIGDTIITVESTRRFRCEEQIVIYNDSDDLGVCRTILSIVSRTQIELDEALDFAFPAATSQIQKLIGVDEDRSNAQFLKAIYLGDPAVIPHFPAITINVTSRSSEWLTIESTSETYEIDITIYVSGVDYEDQYEMMHAYVEAIESALFRSFYPLLNPYHLTTLTEDVEIGDTLIKVADENLLRCLGGWIWIESNDYLRHNKVIESLGNGVYRLALASDRDFEVGDKIIRPLKHIYDALPRATQFGTINKDGMIKAAVINYTAKEEVRRGNQFIDPLTF